MTKGKLAKRALGRQLFLLLLGRPELLYALVSAISLAMASLAEPTEVEGIWGDPGVVSGVVVVWEAGSVISFAAGALSMRVAPRSSLRQDGLALLATVAPEEVVYRRLVYTLFVAALVTVIRIGGMITHLGGINNVTALWVSGSSRISDAWRDTHVFGIGLLSNLTVAVTLVSLTFWVTGRNRQQWGRLFGTSLFLLLLRSLVANERMLILEGLVGGLVTSSIASRRLSGRRALGVAALSLALWIVVENSKVGVWSGGIPARIAYGFERLAFYFTINVKNLYSVLHYVKGHTYGLLTFRFLLSPLGLDDYLFRSDVLSGWTEARQYVLPGLGTLPWSGLAYLDFGVLGLVYIFFWGAVFEYARLRARRSLLWTVLYGYGVASLLVSFMDFLPSLARAWVNILAIAWALSRRRTTWR